MREDKIISALIGLVGACNNNPKTAGTDSLVIKALSYVSYDMDAADLLELLNEAENIEHDIKSGGMKNGQEDYKN